MKEYDFFFFFNIQKTPPTYLDLSKDRSIYQRNPPSVLVSQKTPAMCLITALRAEMLTEMLGTVHFVSLAQLQTF